MNIDGQKFLKFGDIEFEKRRLYSSKSPIDVSDVNIDSIVICDKFPCSKKSFKYLIVYKNNEESMLYVLFPKLSRYLRTKNF